jgi:hypothetical protein
MGLVNQKVNNMEMNKQQFLKFMIGEIERQQKDVYKHGDGKKVVSVLTEIYTLVSDGKFDISKRDVVGEISYIKNSHENFKTGVAHHAY